MTSLALEYRKKLFQGQIKAPETEAELAARQKRDEPEIVPVRPHDSFARIRAGLIKLRLEQHCRSFPDEGPIPHEAYIQAGMTEEEEFELLELAAFYQRDEGVRPAEREKWTKPVSPVVDLLMMLPGENPND